MGATQNNGHPFFQQAYLSDRFYVTGVETANVWKPGKFKDYNSFFLQLKNEMHDDQQTPNLLVFGGEDIGFEGFSPLDLA